MGFGYQTSGYITGFQFTFSVKKGQDSDACRRHPVIFHHPNSPSELPEHAYIHIQTMIFVLLLWRWQHVWFQFGNECDNFCYHYAVINCVRSLSWMKTLRLVGFHANTAYFIERGWNRNSTAAYGNWTNLATIAWWCPPNFLMYRISLFWIVRGELLSVVKTACTALKVTSGYDNSCVKHLTGIIEW